MKTPRRFRHLAACLVLFWPTLAGAQVTPPGTQQIPGLPPGLTPQQAAQLLQQRPDLGRMVQQRLQASGMTPEEIRTRLRAAGYPGSLLDAYLGADTTGLPLPGQPLVQAISLLGLAQFSTRDSLLLTGDTLAYRFYADSLRADSIAREDSLARTSKGLELFGLDVFRQPTTQFQSVVSGPVDDAYVLGPGDALVLILTGAVEDAQTLEVTRAGFVVIPRVGQIYVNNVTLGQLRDVLYDRLSRVYSGVSRSPDAKTKFLITVANVRMLTVRVVGEVGRPGSYQVPATGSVLTALYQAGGLTERAGFRRLEVRRGVDTVGTVDLYDYLTRGITPTGVHLSSGDVIFVPVQGARVKLTGEVKRPAIYESKPGEGLAELVRVAGGLTPEAATGAATIHRILPPDERRELARARTVLTVNLGKVLARDTAAVPLAPGDSITIYPFLAARRNAVTIRGAVAVPGTYRVDPGMRLSDLIGLAGGLREDTYTGRAQVLRTQPDSSRSMIGVAVPLAGGEGDGNPELAERDEVTVFARSDFRPDRYVAVWGAVRKPGYLSYADSMTARDAVLLAGGLREEASLDSIQVSRFRGGVEGGDSLQTVFTVPLDASFVVGQPSYPPQRPGVSRAPAVVLQPYDQVLVRRRPGWEAPGTVVITGEVLYAGHYALRSKDERLRSLIHQAGGLTAAAYANGIQFFRLGGGVRREPVRAAPGERPDTTRPTTWNAATAANLRGPANRQWGTAGRIGVDLERVLGNPAYRDNLILQPGDSIHIPPYIPYVRVEGSVGAPGTSVPYRPGARVKDYVNSAGGFAQLADKKRTFVQQPNGLIQKGGNPNPGAVVVVPERVAPSQGASFLQVFGTILAPLISAATTIAIVIATRP
jgi:protein involved in polysaccharide export with SLBB domain